MEWIIADGSYFWCPYAFITRVLHEAEQLHYLHDMLGANPGLIGFIPQHIINRN